MNELAVQLQDVIDYEFQGGSIRAIEIDGDLWFVANDIASAIGYGDPGDAVYKVIARNEEDFDGCTSTAKLATETQARDYKIINEFGLYSFCMLARTNKAVEFRKFARELISEWRKGKLTNQAPISVEDAVIVAMEGIKELRAQQSENKEEIKRLSVVVDNEVWLTDSQKADIQNAVKWRIGYLKREGYAASFQALYSALKTHFNVPKYDKIPRKSYEHAVNFVRGWYPPRANYNWQPY